MTANTVLSLRHIAKIFAGGTRALDDVSVSVHDGEFLSLVGPSGCGKSTLLRVIANLLSPTTGNVAWPSGEPTIGFVFQEPTLMPWTDALGNVRLPLTLTHQHRSESDARAAQALQRVGLSGFERAFPRELSGGMRMRVSLARALVAEPRLLLLDEPFAALDEITRQSLNDDLLKLWAEDGLTVIFVTHSVFESTYLSSRVLVMTPRPGRIAAEISMQRDQHRTADYRLSPEFAENARRVSEALRSGIERR